ncbi:Calcineurin-like phosphoesterase [Devosia sp. LC5]|uniref:metallophosphoesterase family protein n=1 Tax=Devosia sp. LC5 TaxID=1502724 RepID=UPI0004E3DC10|nr:metallophosphoesterase [Devosia sp. LC5]KFC66679.1 Calcineurin-like phosphoesterase [Devosia sp. LC5]
MTRFAVIADPHFHDAAFTGTGDRLFLRSLADTAESTRVFNESAPAFRAALDQIAAQGIKTVIIVGDLTDDGQAYAVDGALTLLEGYTARLGMRFFMTVGNHDLFARAGRHQSKRILRDDGRYDLVTSDAQASDADAAGRVVTGAMLAGGYDRVVPALGRLGFMRHPQDIHWESPFGSDDALTSRLYTVRSDDGSQSVDMVDASYLVEPAPGLWLLSLDANIYRPKGDGFADCSEAGWNAALEFKPYLLAWTADVVARAQQLGKQLVVFSHYPVVDPLDSTIDEELALLGKTTFARRMPVPAVSEAFLAAGVKLHFSGHWHVNDTARIADDRGYVLNMAVPAPVAFPPAYKICELSAETLHVDTVMLRDVAGYDVGFARYAAECAVTGYDDEGLRAATDHFGFIGRHLDLLVRDRYLPREWPQSLRGMVERVNLGAVARLAGGMLAPDMAKLPFMTAVVDWYKLRKASDLALGEIGAARLEAYAKLAALFGARSWPEESSERQLGRFFGMMMRYGAGLPATRFKVDLASGAVTPD